MSPQEPHEPKAVATVMLKGGTTKSTITANTAEALGRAGYDVLTVDTDPNGHLTANLGYSDLYYDGDIDLGDIILSEGNAAPSDAIQSTNLGFDLLPASVALESVETRLKNEMQPSLCLKQRLVDPLLGDRYDYILMDTHSSRNALVNNAVVAAPNLLLPLIPEQGINSGLSRTQERIINPLKQKIDLKILAMVPNKLSQRIDHKNEDRRLIERICRSDSLSEYLPQFAHVKPETFDAIDADERRGSLPKPGLRKDSDLNDSFKQNKTLGAFNPENTQLEAFDELAEIVVQGEVSQ
ncbi:AAA family ATPase [Haloferax sp. MBLA0076]|uniref:AAA family ATPase n=1 Tax=Haloferax litoreum TaxID=2666140 RepID=A0A6A8GF23_9EURY|nr:MULTISPECIES: ParA family protein [Haloferax]KAB1193217.1 ParA family protein [Haloferax sp. CBA1148]MRX21715.1 AAA family ATPase [Haloferax litoreum]